MANSVCLSETSPTRAALALCGHIMPFWNQDDPRIVNLALYFEPSAGPFKCEQEGGGSTSAGHLIVNSLGCTLWSQN